MTISDIYSIDKRSDIMSKVRQEGTKPEILIRRFLFSHGFRYRKNDKRYPGKPDIVLPKYRTIIFVHGCFWHGHVNCKAATLPKTNTDFWKKKISENIARDQKNIETLRKEGWNVTIIWQCEIENKNKRKKRLDLLLKEITNRR